MDVGRFIPSNVQSPSKKPVPPRVKSDLLSRIGTGLGELVIKDDLELDEYTNVIVALNEYNDIIICLKK